jgi:hypothetical protein
MYVAVINQGGQRFDALPGEGRMVNAFSVGFQFFVGWTEKFKAGLLIIKRRHLLIFRSCQLSNS